MIYHVLTLSIIGMFFVLGAIEPQSTEDTKAFSCSCKKKRSSLKEDQILTCEGHDEPLEEEKIV